MATLLFKRGSSAAPTSKVEISVIARNLKDRDTFSKSDPMCVLFMKSIGSNNFLEVGRTEMIKDCLNPEFVKKFNVDYFFEELQKLKFELGLSTNAGTIIVRAEELANCKELISLKLSGTKLDKKDTFGKSDPFLVISRVNTDDRTIKFDCYDWDSDGSHDFIGAFQATVDDLQQPSKHFDLINPKKKAKKKGYRNSGVNGDASNPYCNGISGVLAAYQRTLHTVQLWGPTNFSPVINHVAKFAEVYQDGSHYFVLLILTDGVITDMPQTKQAVVRASSLPMSIIIVGVGNAEFDAMEELDADNQRLSANGQYAERDIVQFVPFREFVGGRYGNSIEMSKAYLAKEVLAEIPDQVTGFMKKRGINPRPPRTDSALDHSSLAGVKTEPASRNISNDGVLSNQTQQPHSGSSYGSNRAPPPGQQGGYGAPPPGQQGGYGAPPPGQQGGYGAPPPGQQGGYGASPSGQQGGYGASPSGQQGGYGASPPGQPGAYGAPPGQPGAYGAPQPGQQGGYGAPQPGQQGGYGAPPTGPEGGYGVPPPRQQSGYGTPPPGQQGGYSAPPTGQQGGYGVPTPGQQGSYGAPPMGQQGGYGAPPSGQQGGYGTPAAGQQGGYGALPPGQQGSYGAPPPVQQSSYGAPSPGQRGSYGAPPSGYQGHYNTHS
ncbi:hypothetical protein LSH36_178g05059 [Paralvinella palmiformis]|uniref:C2 domain-containing protein n=1 Tax=Paralvinella palmiformis TaxID=53620 RepID=A0AAD9JSY4_9ANNE|nr:hypothetical protein LSH36_178g05059 [Paralvinella palmiformis]